jgi:hypothetical protein
MQERFKVTPSVPKLVVATRMIFGKELGEYAHLFLQGNKIKAGQHQCRTAK